MTSEEKAFELYYEFSKRIDFIDNQLELDIATKKCALLAVDEISENCYEVMKPFWEEVKTELKKL